MNDLRPIPLNSQRLVLRPSVDGDADYLFASYFGSLSASRFLSRAPHSSVGQTNDFLDKWTLLAWQEAGKPFAWVIAKRETNEPVGIFLVFQKENIAEIHYGVSEQHSGQGMASEACETAANWLLEQDYIQKVWTAVDTDHAATQRVLEKAGFVKEGLLKNWAVLPAFGEEARDAVAYSKIKRSPIT